MRRQKVTHTAMSLEVVTTTRGRSRRMRKGNPRSICQAPRGAMNVTSPLSPGPFRSRPAMILTEHFLFLKPRARFNCTRSNPPASQRLASSQIVQPPRPGPALQCRSHPDSHTDPEHRSEPTAASPPSDRSDSPMAIAAPESPDYGIQRPGWSAPALPPQLSAGSVVAFRSPPADRATHRLQCRPSIGPAVTGQYAVRVRPAS